MIKIDKKIVGYSVVNDPNSTKDDNKPMPGNEVIANQENINEEMSEKYKRPDILRGFTYRIKTPLFDSAMYITINNVVLNAGTPYEHERPFELFINSKEMSNFQWIVALTRIISAVFRKGGDVVFLVEELKSVFDPKGGYFNKGKYIPSLVAELGDVVERHLKMMGLIEDEHDPHVEAYIKEKRQQVQQLEAKSEIQEEDDQDSENQFPPNAIMCDKCHQKAAVLMDGCLTCLSCGASKCN